VLGGDIQHPRDLAQHRLSAVIVLIALDHHDPVGFVYGEIEAGELFRPLTAELDDGLSVGGIARRLEELV
jgi:hypothetical protein